MKRVVVVAALRRPWIPGATGRESGPVGGRVSEGQWRFRQSQQHRLDSMNNLMTLWAETFRKFSQRQGAGGGKDRPRHRRR